MTAAAVTPAATPAAAEPGGTPDLTAVLDVHALVRTAGGLAGQGRVAGRPDAGGLSASDAPPSDDPPSDDPPSDDPDVLGLSAGTVAVGAAHTCAIGPFGDVWCFGDNTAGQLGVAGDDTGPVRVAAEGGLAGRAATAVSAGRTHTCALAEDDPDADSAAVYCWGGNDHGQVGDGSTTDRPTPVKVIADAVRVAAGRDHTCALLQSGEVYCWGRNDAGQLGTGTADTGADTPQPVAGLSEVQGISANGDTTCAVVLEGGARCWGSDSDGQLGDGADGADDMQPAPVEVLATDVTGDIVDVAVGRRHVCALTDTAAVYCWGSDAAGQLGNGPDSADQPAPVAVRGDESFVGVAAGGDVGCAINRRGQAFCWGDNTDGQLGVGDHDDRGVPTAVDQSGVRSSPITELVFGSRAAMLATVAVGDAHACAADVMGDVYCWGANATGQLGDGTTTASDVPNGTRLSPDAAENLRVTPAERALGVAWTAPRATGVAPVAEYAALAISGRGSESLLDVRNCSTTALSCRIGSLTNNRPYDVLVGAATSAGVSYTAAKRAAPAASGSGGGLPITGGAVGGLVAVAGVLIAAGVLGVVLGNRRRDRFRSRSMP